MILDGSLLHDSNPGDWAWDPLRPLAYSFGNTTHSTPPRNVMSFNKALSRQLLLQKLNESQSVPGKISVLLQQLDTELSVCTF
jgi:hypothetical protein